MIQEAVDKLQAKQDAQKAEQAAREAVVLAMDRYARLPRGRSGSSDFDEAIERGREWVLGLQSRNGGWGAFDADNNKEYLNNPVSMRRVADRTFDVERALPLVLQMVETLLGKPTATSDVEVEG